MPTPDTFRYDSPAPAHAEACATHRVQAVLIVTAEVPEGTTPEHLALYAASFFNGERADELHEDIFDELDAAVITGRARGVVGSLSAAAARLVQQVQADETAATEAMEQMLDAAESPGKGQEAAS